MTKLLKPHDYNTSVFINCPYDSAFEPLLHGIVFAVHHMNLKPKLALDSVDAGHPRLEKIFHLIQNCKYSIHDLSRTELDPNHGFPRFNMAFELGLDLGCKRFGKRHHEEKRFSNRSISLASCSGTSRAMALGHAPPLLHGCQRSLGGLCRRQHRHGPPCRARRRRQGRRQ